MAQDSSYGGGSVYEEIPGSDHFKPVPPVPRQRLEGYVSIAKKSQHSEQSGVSASVSDTIVAP